MKASIENHDKIVQLLVTAGAKLDLLHQVQRIHMESTILFQSLFVGGWKMIASHTSPIALSTIDDGVPLLADQPPPPILYKCTFL
jgi:hypothetical protein